MAEVLDAVRKIEGGSPTDPMVVIDVILTLVLMGLIVGDFFLVWVTNLIWGLVSALMSACLDREFSERESLREERHGWWVFFPMIGFFFSVVTLKIGASYRN